jgi:squalene synthase HpnC
MRSGSALAQPTEIPVAAGAATQEPRPSRTAEKENFPVGSWLLPARLRRHIATYYAFARAADDIADDPVRSAARKVAELDAMEAALEGSSSPGKPSPDLEKAHALRASLAETGVPVAHGAELLRAFRQDALKRRYRDWDELMDYCRYSAAPVGRYLLDLHGESRAAWPASDALCASLQVLNHLQDCRADYLRLDRVYLPLDAFEAEGASVEDLARGEATRALRAVLERCLDRCDRLNRDARALPGLLRDRRMRAEAAVIVAIAHRLAARLRRSDPLALRVELSAPDKLACLARGVWTAVR